MKTDHATPRLYVVAFPEISPEQAGWIEQLRAEHDAAGQALLGAHFTFVFGCTALSVAELTQEVRVAAEGTGAIDFVCDRAALELHGGTHYVYLCPGEGAEAMRRLYGRLHSGRLQPPSGSLPHFVPHMTVCKTADAAQAQALCARLNVDGVHVRGRIGSLCIGALDDAGFEVLARVVLEAPRA